MYLVIMLGPIFTLIVFSFIFNILPQKFSFFIIFGSLFFSFIFCCFVVYEVVYLNSFCLIELKTWFKVGSLNIKWSFFFDKLSTFMLFLIIFVSLLVHFFALDYLNEDPHLSRFFFLLSLFTIFMEILVTSGNLLQFFFGWEGVGLMSYLLINFWFTRYAAANSGLMAIIYNRIGDSSILLAISLICLILETTDFISLFLMTKVLCQIQLHFFNVYFYILDFLVILLFLGVIGKSAQIFLESWLASAMEGPTPVSSLLHASTMIVSGAFLLQRFQPYILSSLNGMILITFVGALTAFFAGTIGMVAMDLKRIIAYSTCSQMGYLVFCVGIGNTNVSFFHLFNHAFFKCLLFVAAGTLIHALLNDQDIRQMGGLFKLFPFTFILIFFASFSLMGIPFLSGYYSKEKILEYSFYIYNHSNLFAFWLGSFSAFLTSLYSLRLLFFSFFNFPNNFKSNYEDLHTNVRMYLNLVLFFLGLGTIFSGYLFEDLIIGFGTDWLLFTSTKLNLYLVNIHLGQLYLNFLAFYYTCFGLFISFIFFYNSKEFNYWFINLFFNNEQITIYYFKKGFISKKLINLKFFRLFYIFFGKRWYINLIYNRYLASLSFFLGYSETFILLDKGFFEGVSLLSIRKINKLTSFLSLYFYRNFYFGEMLLYVFLLYFTFFYLFYFLIFGNFLENFFNQIYITLINSFWFFSIYFLIKVNFSEFYAVPKKRKRRTKIKKLISLCQKKVFSQFISSKIFFINLKK